MLNSETSLTAQREKARDEGKDWMENLRSSGVLDDFEVSAKEDEQVRRLKTAIHLLRKTQMVSLRPILPLLLSLKGEPYTIDDYFPFETFFRTFMPKETVLKTARQCTKSTSLAAQGLILSNCIPYFSTLYVTPLYEMIRRFSTSYVGDFIANSPIARLFMDRSTMNSVLQRSFKNRAKMYFSFAFLSPDRTRGVPADKLSIDEVQDMDATFVPVIKETLSGSKWGITQYAGTPKSLDNTIEKLWTDSSMAEWLIKCHRGGCGHWNVPALEHDLLDMIGPASTEVSEKRPGVVCAKCRKPLRPRQGRWVHRRKDRRVDFAGYHVPQCVLPMHYADPVKWATFVGKREGRGNTTFTTFLNEACGESCDFGSRIVTETDLKQAAVLPWENSISEAEARASDYVFKILAVDWGGGGSSKASGKKAESGYKAVASYTVLVAMGMKSDGRIDVLWGMRSLTPHDHVREAKLCIGAVRRLGLSHIAHDYTGAGSLRETIINQAGFAWDRLVPIQLGRTGVRDIMAHHPASEQHPRDFYVIDKPRTLQLTCQWIKTGMLRFFKYDFKGSEEPGLIRDFLALVEEKTSTRLGGDVYSIHKDPNLCDDFAQAVNIGCVTLWKLSGRWPDVTAAAKMEVDPALMSLCSPANPWEEDRY